MSSLSPIAPRTGAASAPISSTPISSASVSSRAASSGAASAGAAGRAAHERDPFFRKTLDHFRWPLLPSASLAEKIGAAGDRDLLALLAPPESLLQRNLRRRPGEAAPDLAALAGQMARHVKKATGAETIASQLKAQLAHEARWRDDFTYQRQLAVAC